MPAKVKVRVVAGRNLPVMDRSSDTTDAYVEVKVGNTTFKTDVFRKSLNPQWNSEWFTFEVDDLELQDEPLQIRLMDHDTYSANDAIGKVYVDLNPLLLAPAQPLQNRTSQELPNCAGSGLMSGWLPVYDTMHGIRGEVNIVVKVDLFSDFNKFRQSSCGVQFFFTPAIPAGFRCNSIIGFVEEIVVNDDPEYQWIDKIRTPRASNEARQTLFFKLSGELQRRIGLKVLEQGGNAVVGYNQCFDLEGESGIAVRGIGSVISLTRIAHDGNTLTTTHLPSLLPDFGTSGGMVNPRDPNSKLSKRVSMVQSSKSSSSLVSQEAIFGGFSKRTYSVGQKTAGLNREKNKSDSDKKTKRKSTKSCGRSKSVTTMLTSSSNTSTITSTKDKLERLGKSLDVSPVHPTKKLTRVAFLPDQSTLQESEKKIGTPKGSRKLKFNHFTSSTGKSAMKKSKKEKTGGKDKFQTDVAENSKISKQKLKICHVLPKCMSSLYFKSIPPLPLNRNVHFMGKNDIPFIAELGRLTPIETDLERQGNDEIDREITTIETFYSGIQYSYSDPTLNQSTCMKDFLKDIYCQRPLIILTDEGTQNSNSDSELSCSEKKTIATSVHPKFYLSESSSSSLSESVTIDKEIVKEDKFSHSPLFRFPPSQATEGNNTATIQPKSNMSPIDALAAPLAFVERPVLSFPQDTNSSRRSSLAKGSFLHSSPGSLPDIRVVPCSPTPSSAKSLAFCENLENSFTDNQSADICSCSKSPLSSSSSIFTDLFTETRETSLVCSHSGSSSSSLDSSHCKYCMSSDGKDPSSTFRALGVHPSHSLLCVVPAECRLSPSPFPCSPPAPVPSLPHSSSLPLHVSPHSFVDLTATHTTAELSSRSGISPSTVSPKRGSRLRKTSGSYSISRSPQPQEGVGDSATTVDISQSPTHSVKIASPSHTPGGYFNRRSSDSDLSLTPKGGSLTGSGGSSAGKGVTGGGQKPLMTQESFDNFIYPFLTMKSFPPNFIIHLGGTVSARSVKLLDRSHLPEEVDSRDSWWAQLRTEIRSHARSIACNVVLGYEEFTTICDEVCVLNATGTAAVINISHHEMETIHVLSSKPFKDPLSVSLEKKDLEAITNKVPTKESQQQNAVSRSHPNVIEDLGECGGNLSGNVKLPTQAPSAPRPIPPPCAICHIPYTENANPFNVKILKCSVCKKGKVPDVLLTTLELPSTIPTTGRGCLIQARVVRSKKDLKGELNAKEISDSLPFLEYELHKQLYQKIMIKGMNSIFGLRVRVTVGEKLVVGLGTGTAVYLNALPPPPMPRLVISGTGVEVEKRRTEMQKKIQEIFEKNKEIFGLRFNNSQVDSSTQPLTESKSSDTEDSDEELLDFDLLSGNKDAYILDFDDLEDCEMFTALLEGSPSPHLISVSTQMPPGFPFEQTVANLQMFTRVWRGKMPPSISQTLFSSYFESLLKSIYFRVRNLSPCIISGLKLDVELPEADEIQISVLGMVLGMGQQPPFTQSSSCGSQAPGGLKGQQELESKSKPDDTDLIFTMEEVGRETEEKLPPPTSNQPIKTLSFMTRSCNMITSTLQRSTSSTQSFPSVPSAASISSGSSSARSSFKIKAGEKQTINYYLPPKGDHFGVEITPLSFIPGAKIERYLGNLNFFFIRESTSIKENGGLGSFMGSFITEVLALVRAHVAAVGGHAMISYFLSQCVLLHNPHKNQGQCLINVGGDIVQVVYNKCQEQPEINQQINSQVADTVNSVNSLISE